MTRTRAGAEGKPRKYEPGWSGYTRGGYSPGLGHPNGTNFGTYTAEDCPRENCQGKVVYNGNYFCEFWGWDPDGKPLPEGACDWALPHPQTEYADKLLSWKLTGAWEQGEVPDPNDRYNTLWIEHNTEPAKPAESEDQE